MLSAIRTTSSNSDFQTLIQMLDSDLNKRYGALQEQYNTYNASNLISDVIVLYDDQMPLGCGAFKPFDQSSVEIKRMFVRPEVRGKGIASRILSELEAWACELGFSSAVLETGQKQTEAIALYRKCGFQHIENYGQYKGNANSLCFNKPIGQTIKA